MVTVSSFAGMKRTGLQLHYRQFGVLVAMQLVMVADGVTCRRMSGHMVVSLYHGAPPITNNNPSAATVDYTATIAAGSTTGGFNVTVPYTPIQPATTMWISDVGVSKSVQLTAVPSPAETHVTEASHDKGIRRSHAGRFALVHARFPDARRGTEPAAHDRHHRADLFKPLACSSRRPHHSRATLMPSCRV